MLKEGVLVGIVQPPPRRERLRAAAEDNRPGRFSGVRPIRKEAESLPGESQRGRGQDPVRGAPGLAGESAPHLQGGWIVVGKRELEQRGGGGFHRGPAPGAGGRSKEGNGREIKDIATSAAQSFI